jgi:NAD(P)-dependent dehydrogenase (short-subunit alcohol dehydrogenase family)
LSTADEWKIGEISDADWLRFFETNVMSGVRLARHYLPGMRGRDWGRIIFVSSESAVQIPAEMIHYGRLRDQRHGPAGGWRRGACDSLITKAAPTLSRGRQSACPTDTIGHALSPKSAAGLLHLRSPTPRVVRSLRLC